MATEKNLLGILSPTGGGDPVPLKKEQLTIGRRPKCDIQLDFENVSGKHCALRFHQGVWYARDLGSTNGTTLNGQKLGTEQAVLPSDELVIATHPFRIDYEPSGEIPDAAAEEGGPAKPVSLLEMAGLESEDRPRPRQTKQPTAPIRRPSAQEANFDDALPQDFQAPPPKQAAADDDDDFFKMIQGDV